MGRGSAKAKLRTLRRRARLDGGYPLPSLSIARMRPELEAMAQGGDPHPDPAGGLTAAHVWSSCSGARLALAEDAGAAVSQLAEPRVTVSVDPANPMRLNVSWPDCEPRIVVTGTFLVEPPPPPCEAGAKRQAFDLRKGNTTSQAALDFIKRTCRCCKDHRPTPAPRWPQRTP